MTKETFKKKLLEYNNKVAPKDEKKKGSLLNLNTLNITLLWEILFKKKPIKTRSAKNKGARLQKGICGEWSIVLDIPYNQSDDMCPIHSREMGQHGVDVIIRDNRAPFDIECKNTEKLDLWGSIKQAKENNPKPDRDWLLYFTRNKEPNYVCMESKTFHKIYKEYLELKYGK